MKNINVTYLIGAGASYNALPVIEELEDRLNEFSNQIENSKFEQNREGLFEKKDKLLKDLSWMVSQTSNHQTIDTFARKLFLNSRYHEDLFKLKRLITLYFLFEQIKLSQQIRTKNNSPVIKQVPDKRYDSFIASILTDEIDTYNLNSNIKIISWNYDSQFEIALRNFIGSNCNIIEAQKRLQVTPQINYGDKIELDLEKFFIVKLNGSAFLNNEIEENTFLDRFNKIKDRDEVFEYIVEKYHLMNLEKAPTEIHYSWENQTNSKFSYKGYKEIDKIVRNVSSNTEILVVIGYSFPIFNRSIDKRIIQNMGKLRRVYIQDVFPEKIESLMRSSFSNLVSTSPALPNFIRIEKNSNTSNFLIPPELN